ncbi:hypothetical protein P9112_006736 [Eukaryota sp. TZLM1-RC]
MKKWFVLFFFASCNAVYFFDQVSMDYCLKQDGSTTCPFNSIDQIYDHPWPVPRTQFLLVFLSKGPFYVNCDLNLDSFHLTLFSLFETGTVVEFIPSYDPCPINVFLPYLGSVRLVNVNVTPTTLTKSLHIYFKMFFS